MDVREEQGRQILAIAALAAAAAFVAVAWRGLFGSFARGTAHADSDIDVLLVRPETLTEREEDLWLDQVDGLDRAIKAWTGNSAQVIDLTPATLGQMARKNDPLVDSWRAEGIHLYGERLI